MPKTALNLALRNITACRFSQRIPPITLRVTHRLTECATVSRIAAEAGHAQTTSKATRGTLQAPNAVGEIGHSYAKWALL